MMNLPRLEQEASAHAERILTLLEEKDGRALARYLAGLTRDQIQYALYAIGNGYHREVAANALAADQLAATERVCANLTAGNVELLETVRSMTEDRDNQAQRTAALRHQLQLVGVRAA